MIAGAIPYVSFKQQRNIIDGLKAKYRGVKIEILDGIVFYELNRSIKHDRFNEV